jgi:hypothetical protein
MTSLAHFGVLALAVACVGGAGRAVLGEASSSAVEAELGCQQRNGENSLRITLRNRDSVDTAVVLGNILANGAKYLADNLALDVRTGSVIRQFRYGDPSVPGVAGRSDAWVASLPAGSEFTLIRPLNHFWWAGEHASPANPSFTVLSAVSRPFAARLSFVSPPTPSVYAIPSFKVYQGQLTSGWVEIPTQCVAG